MQIVLALTIGGKYDGQCMDNILNTEHSEFVDRLRKNRLRRKMMFQTDSTAQSQPTVVDEERISINLQVGRLYFPKIINSDGKVFFHGSSNLHLAVRNACKEKKGVSLIAGSMYDGDVIKKHMALSSFRRRLCTRETNV